MGLFKRISRLLGFVKDVNHVVTDEEDDDNAHAQLQNRVHMQQIGMTHKEFNVSAQIFVDRPNKLGPILVPSGSDDCGVHDHLPFFPLDFFVFFCRFAYSIWWLRSMFEENPSVNRVDSLV